MQRRMQCSVEKRVIYEFYDIFSLTPSSRVPCLTRFLIFTAVSSSAYSSSKQKITAKTIAIHNTAITAAIKLYSHCYSHSYYTYLVYSGMNRDIKLIVLAFFIFWENQHRYHYNIAFFVVIIIITIDATLKVYMVCKINMRFFSFCVWFCSIFIGEITSFPSIYFVFGVAFSVHHAIGLGFM